MGDEEFVVAGDAGAGSKRSLERQTTGSVWGVVHNVDGVVGWASEVRGTGTMSMTCHGGGAVIGDF